MSMEDQPLTRREFYDAILPNLATKADLAEVKADLARLETNLVKWMVGLMITSMIGASSLAYAAVRLFGT